MHLKNDKIVVTIKNTIFRSDMVAPFGQFVLDPTAMVGWTDGTAARRNNTVRPVTSGDFTEPYTLSSRLISISGTAIASNAGQLQQMRDQFVGLLQEREYVEISVETSAGLRYATVGLEGTPAFTKHLDNVASFKLDLYAPDAHVYGVERVVNVGSSTSAGGGIKTPLSYPLNYNVQNPNQTDSTVTNRGNAPAWPKFIVAGDYYSGFTLTDGGDKRITYNGMVTTSSPVIIDTARGVALQGGTDRSVYVSERGWFSIAPNETIRPTFKPIQAASGWCDIMIRDTFI